MNKLFIALALAASVSLTGCITPDSANVYKKDQMQKVARARAGVIENIRDIEMKDSSGIGTIVGGAIGGIAAGSNIGNGSGSAISAIIGAVVGGLIGNEVEKGVVGKKAKELTIKMQDNGERLVIVQDPDVPLSVGDQVDVITDGRSARVQRTAGQPHFDDATPEARPLKQDSSYTL